MQVLNTLPLVLTEFYTSTQVDNITTFILFETTIAGCDFTSTDTETATVTSYFSKSPWISRMMTLLNLMESVESRQLDRLIQMLPLKI